MKDPGKSGPSLCAHYKYWIKLNGHFFMLLHAIYLLFTENIWHLSLQYPHNSIS